MAQETMKLSVDTGSILIDIDDKGDIIGQFRFNPNDLDIINRFEKVVEKLESLSIPDDADTDAVFRVADEIKTQMDYLLNYDVSKEIFSKCNPLTLTTSGDFYFENVIEGVAELIEKTTNKRIAKKKAKIQKATAKYHK